MKNTLRSFDVDFSPCDCKGTLHPQTHMQVIAVRWKRSDKDPRGRVKFQCMRCKTSWSMKGVGGGKTKLVLDASHTEEIKRRAKIHKYYDEVIAVNLGGRSPSGHFPGGKVDIIGGTRLGTTE